MRTFKSASGLTLPAIGLGTYKMWGVDGAKAVTTAVDGGYRLLDSAFNYENEGAVGRGLRDSEVERKDVVVTSKLPGRHHEAARALRTIEESVYRTGLDYIDLYLIHWPNPKVGHYVEAWEALIEARDRGLVKHIGVSNFLPEHLERLDDETGVLPEVNQIELHPYFPQEDALKVHAELGIITESWSPIGRGNDVTERQEVVTVADAHGITPTQAVLAWHVNRGALPLPKSSDPGRQQENLAAAEIDLSPEEIASISSLASEGGRLKDQDPAQYEEF